MADSPRLDEFDKIEWRDVVRLLRPDWTEAKFEAAWAKFIAMKKRRKLN